LGYEPTTVCHVRDLYAQMDLGTATGSFTAIVDIHAGVALRITPVAGHLKPHHVDWRPWKQQQQKHSSSKPPVVVLTE